MVKGNELTYLANTLGFLKNCILKRFSQMSRVCQVCGESLEGKRSDTKTCSAACRSTLSAERKKGRVQIDGQQERVQGPLEEKLSRIEQYMEGCRSLMKGKSEGFSRGVKLRALFEIGEVAQGILPDQNAVTSYEQREKEWFAVGQKAGW